MSTMVYGKIKCNNMFEVTISSLNFTLVQYCVDRGIGIRFKLPINGIDSTDVIFFQLSDDFMVTNCEDFMDSPYYSIDSKQVFGLKKLQSDIETIVGICKMCFNNPHIKHIEIYITFGEAEEEDFTVYNTTTDQLESIIVKEYLVNGWVPTLKLCVANNI